VYKDGPEFYATFGSVLKFNDDLITLGKRIIDGIRTIGSEEHDGRFLGLHLRSESDAMGFWPDYNAQASGYIAKARERGYKRAYLATGNQTEALKFAEQAQREAGLTVYTAADLLSTADLNKLTALSWDQRGVVDFVALLASEYFVGVMPSSFSVYMAIRRHLRTGGLYTRPFKTDRKGDGLSYLVGNYEQYWEGWLFMWDGMWP